jgi:anaphase-promoting complex subunit 8
MVFSPSSFQPNNWLAELREFIRSSELYYAIPSHKRDTLISEAFATFSTSTPARSRSPRPSLSFADPSPAPTAPLSISITPGNQAHLLPHSLDVHTQEIEWEAQDEAALLAAQAFMAAKEFTRVEFTVKGCKSAKARFLYVYSCFLVCRTNHNLQQH